MERRHWFASCFAALAAGCLPWKPVVAAPRKWNPSGKPIPAKHTFIWTGPGENWNDPTNWVGGKIPTDGADLIIIEGGECPIYSLNGVIGELRVLNGAANFCKD